VARWPSTLRWRLTLWYSVLLGAPLIALAVGYYLFFARTLYTRTDQFISDALVAFSRELVAERRVASGVASAMRSTVDEVRFRDLQIAILDSAARVVAMTPLPENGANADRRRLTKFDDWIAVAVRGRDLTKEETTTIDGPGGPYRLTSRPLVLAGQRFAVTGTYSLADIASVLERIRRMFAVVVPFLIVCAATGGYFLAARSLAPIASMAARAAEISATNLRDRLPVSGGEELAGLARVVNDLLGRLEASFSQQRRFMADASHELRTPTAIIRAEADVALAHEHRREEEYRATVSVMRDAARRLTRIVDDLFLLARADSGNLVARREPVYLEELVYDATRAVRPLADQRSIRIELQDVVEAPFEGDADLLGRLLLNLLDNAIKHAPDGSAVEVIMSHGNAVYEIAVVDAGLGIPAESRERIFERFVRLDAARARSEQSSTSGAGLGLAIARRIAEVHGGRLELMESRPGRTEFRVTLPAAAETPTVVGV
jgi:two-component system OmpR family sensor kinase